MRKRIVSLLLVIVLLTSTSGCSKSDSSKQTGIIRPDSNDKKPEITILVDPFELETLRSNKFMNNYKSEFEKKFGVRVNYKEIGDKKPSETGEESYRKELAAILHVKDGPELIYFTGISIVNSMIEQGAAVDLVGKVPNINKIYDKLLDEKVYYMPIEMRYWPRLLNKKVMDELGIGAPRDNWTQKDYNEIRKKWLEQGNRIFGRRDYYETAIQYLYDIKLMDEGDQKVIINTPEIRDRIRKIRNEIFSGKYILRSNYTYENYYNLFFEFTSKEYKENFDLYRSVEYADQCLVDNDASYGVDLFRAKGIDQILDRDIVMPRLKEEEKYIYTYGFLVNKNGKNQELAFEFLNGLLSDEVQMDIYMDEFTLYPVNKDIEDDIRNIEMSSKLDKRALELKDYALNELKNGSCRLFATADTTEDDIGVKLRNDLIQFVFADKEYSDEELSKGLQKIEDKYNIWLNE